MVATELIHVNRGTTKGAAGQKERLNCCLQYVPRVLITAGAAGRDADSQTPELATFLQSSAWETVQEYYVVKY